MKKILFSILAVVACVAMTGGAFAYFTDVETSTSNAMSAGTLGMQIGDNNEGYGDIPVSASFTSPAAWAPGQEFTTDPIYFKNTGSIEIQYIFARFCELNNATGAAEVDPETPGINNISKKIKLVSYFEKAEADGDFYEEVFDESNANSYLNFWHFPEVGYITLDDLVAANPAGSSIKTGLWLFDSSAPAPIRPAMPVGKTAQVKFKFQLLAETNNAYQGDIASFRVDFVAAQTGTLLDVSITEPVGNLYVP